MSLKFLHTADWQLGRPFASVADEGKRFRLQQQRFEVIQGFGSLISERDLQFVLVAGDLFDSSQATKASVSAACAAIGALEVPVYVIPGNHDHGGAGTIWQQEFFLREQSALAPNLEVLLRPEPIEVPGAILFPAPLMHRHEPVDPTRWIREAIVAEHLPEDLPRIIFGHGSVAGFGGGAPDEEGSSSSGNWIDLSRFPESVYDYAALGDWHGTKQVGPKAWYSGTPETDRFPKGEGNRPGNVLQVKVERGQAPEVEVIRSARFEWRELDFRFSGDESLAVFDRELEDCIGPASNDSLLRLRLDGSLGIEASNRLQDTLESWGARLLRLKLENQARVVPSDDELAMLTDRSADPLVASVAGQLVNNLDEGDEENQALARLALRELHAHLSACTV